MRGWLDGLRVNAIANLLAVKEATLARTDVTAFTDTFCGNYMPWALNPVPWYVGSIAPNSVQAVKSRAYRNQLKGFLRFVLNVAKSTP